MPKPRYQNLNTQPRSWHSPGDLAFGVAIFDRQTRRSRGANGRALFRLFFLHRRERAVTIGVQETRYFVKSSFSFVIAKHFGTYVGAIRSRR
jgi:hypothetical protein